MLRERCCGAVEECLASVDAEAGVATRRQFGRVGSLCPRVRGAVIIVGRGLPTLQADRELHKSGSIAVPTTDKRRAINGYIAGSLKWDIRA